MISLAIPSTHRYSCGLGMNYNTIIVCSSFLILGTILVSVSFDDAFADKLDTFLAFEFDQASPVVRGYIVAMKGTVTTVGNGHAAIDPVEIGTLRIEQGVDASHVGVSDCSSVNHWDILSSGTPVGGEFTHNFDTKGLGGGILVFRAKYVTPGGSHTVATTIGDCTPLVIAGGGSARDYRTKPTFGLDHQTDFVLVEGGFTANGKVFDITDNFHTDFERQAILVGQTNTFSAKAYAEHVLNSVEFMFGVPKVGLAHMAEASIEVTIDRDLNITNIRVVQNDNLIDPDSASVMMAQCKSSVTVKKCYYVTVSAKFNEAPLNDVFALKGTDFDSHTHLTHLNEGFTVFGDSLNPATTLMIAANVKGGDGLMQVIQIDKRNDIWIDESGNEYERNSFDTFVKTTAERLVRDDPMVKVMTRYNSNFETMKQNELDKATAIFDSSLIQNELPDSFRILDGERTSKLQDPEVQLKLFIERMRAEEKLNQLMQMWYAKPSQMKLPPRMT